MSMIVKQNSIKGAANKDVIIDYRYLETGKQLPAFIFIHGFKGYKDWGAWNLMANTIAQNGYLVVKFNFSHNGGTTNHPVDFNDLESFGKNRYSYELVDLEAVLNWLKNSNLPINYDEITLAGHSRGAGIAIITANKFKYIKNVITIAGVSDYESRFPTGTALTSWKENGVYYITNGRTKQEMPLNYTFYEDFILYKDTLNIKKATKNLTCNQLIIHGTLDPTVHLNDAFAYKQWNPKAQMAIINGADHVFQASQPWNKNNMPEPMQRATQCMINFLNNSLS